MYKILVTGVGAIIGYGILRSLRKTKLDLHLIGADIYDDAVGQAWVDVFVQAPLTSSKHYLDWLEKVIIEHQINLVIPGIEQDVHFFSEHREFFKQLSVSVVLNNERLITLTQDKWLMHEELASINSEARIPSYLSGSFQFLSKELGVPFIVKPRCGYASKGLLIIKGEEEYTLLAARIGNELMAQPIIGSDDEEYTVAIFGDGNGSVCASITLQRKLAADGSTSKARVCHHESLDEVVVNLCAHFKPIGPTNLQFRKNGEGWKLLEINPRMSSTTSLRTAFGYNEAKMCLDFYLSNDKIVQPMLKNGFAARYIEDFVIYDRDYF